MARNGFFGVKNAHIARLTNEETFTYEKLSTSQARSRSRLSRPLSSRRATAITRRGWTSTRITAALSRGRSTTSRARQSCVLFWPTLSASTSTRKDACWQLPARHLSRSHSCASSPDTSLESAVASTSARASPHPSMQRHLRTSPTSRSLITILRSAPSSCRAAGAAATSTHMAILKVTTNSSKR